MGQNPRPHEGQEELPLWSTPIVICIGPVAEQIFGRQWGKKLPGVEYFWISEGDRLKVEGVSIRITASKIFFGTPTFIEVSSKISDKELGIKLGFATGWVTAASVGDILMGKVVGEILLGSEN